MFNTKTIDKSSIDTQRTSRHIHHHVGLELLLEEVVKLHLAKAYEATANS